MTIRLLALAAISVVLVFPPRAALTAQVLQPLMVDWASYFTIDWQKDHGLVRGTVSNPTGWGARRIQLLVEGLDATGQIVNQRVVWLGVDLAPASHASFEVRMVPASDRYQVRVFAFDTSRRK
jgi:hypothetical protein